MVFPLIGAALAGSAGAAATIGAIGTIGGAAIGAISSNNIMKRNEELARLADKRAWKRSHPKVTRRRMERAGFNPLLSFTSGGVGAAQPYRPHFAQHENNGAEIGRMIAGGFESAANHFFQAEQLELQRTELDMERQRLQDISARMTLTPKYAGIYGANNANTGPSGGNTVYPDSAGNSGSPWPQKSEVRIPPARDQYNLYVDVYDSQTGRWMTIPNPDLTDTGPMEAAHSLATIGAADVAQNGMKFGGTGAIERKVAPKPRPYNGAQRNSYQHMSQADRDAYREAHRSGFMMMSDPSNLYFYNQ